MEVADAIERFDSRGKRLANQALLFLALVFLLLVGGVAAVILAPNLTAGDIGSPTYDEKIVTINREQAKIRARRSDLAEPERKCGRTVIEAIRRWQQAVQQPSSQERFAPKSGLEVVSKVESAFSDKPDVNSVQVGMFICHGEYGFSISKQQLDEFRSTFPIKLITDQIERETEIASLEARSKSLDAITDQTNLEKLEAEVGLIKSTETLPKNGSDLFLRLLQTSVTRFGLLAVIGFFVSILVSLYRYNIRLAAFYTARADLLRLLGSGATVSEYSLLAAALTPTLEFGKVPQPPLGQLAELIKAAKEAVR
ncbi:hypothetical protein ACQR0V_17240 [Bradyrhizobium sp. HKCCYLS2058]|uniref:hypothetical protein n=1 Tax=unclassified Bradyrhizobium TaxID=2631580 RepID=UPI002916594A|nr:hypothetical protein [Bradyrhizobium sp. SZCCHNRI1009]